VKDAFLTETKRTPQKKPASPPEAFPDILTLLRARGAMQPTRIAIEDTVNGTKITYEALLAYVEALAVRLIESGVKWGESRIGIVLPNGAAMSQALLAVSCVGTALPFNQAYTGAEFDAYFSETEISHLLTASGVAPLASLAAERLGVPVLDLDLLGGQGSITQLKAKLPPPASEATALVLLTSGSTGKAKRVPLSHRNVCTAAHQVSLSMGLTADDRCLSMWELFHVGGLVDLLVAPLHSGGTVIATPGFGASAFFDLLDRARPTWYQAVPTALGELTLHARRAGLDPRYSSLRLIRSVAAALSPALMAEVEQMFGVPVLQTFGMTEAGPLIASTELPPALRYPGAVGRPWGTEVGIFAADWSLLADGNEGEVAIRGPNVFSGYEADPEANADAFREGWFRTGDLGRFDDNGMLYLTGRIKELVNRGGEKVNLREVDDALLRHPGVLEAACFPVPHRTLGEDVAAAVVLRPGSDVTPEALRAELSKQIAAFKVPRTIAILPSLQRNAVGKIDRRAVAAEATALLEAQAATADAAAPVSADQERTEARIAAIWARELGLASVEPEDDFIGLGGDSLAGLRMLLAVEAELAIALPSDVLTDLTTVRSLAQVVTTQGVPVMTTTETSESSLSISECRQIQAIMGMGRIPALHPGSIFKVINSRGTRRPLIWFFNRPATEMLALAAFMPPDQPVYGAFSGGKLFRRDDEKLFNLAKLYADELAKLFPEGNFLIGGNCQGGQTGWMVAKLLMDANRQVDALCCLEYSHRELLSFGGQTLLMFGRHSKQMSYRPINWGRSGWKSAFFHPPVVSWIDGTHGGFFREDTIFSFVKTLMAFLDGAPLVEGTLDSAAGRRAMRLHRLPVAFKIYRLSYKLLAWLRFGRASSFNPFTGESTVHDAQSKRTGAS
jgi:acyl-CoA synthetase (AMP-forming)/AMP-acid ligase II/acyl carrier protein